MITHRIPAPLLYEAVVAGLPVFLRIEGKLRRVVRLGPIQRLDGDPPRLCYTFYYNVGNAYEDTPFACLAEQSVEARIHMVTPTP